MELDTSSLRERFSSTIREFRQLYSDTIAILFDDNESEQNREYLSLTAGSECCDFTYFIVSPEMSESLNGKILLRIVEDEPVENHPLENEVEHSLPFPTNDENDCVQVFPITITVNTSEGIEEKFVFHRVDISNGYYGGFLWTHARNESELIKVDPQTAEIRKILLSRKSLRNFTFVGRDINLAKSETHICLGSFGCNWYWLRIYTGGDIEFAKIELMKGAFTRLKNIPFGGSEFSYANNEEEFEHQILRMASATARNQ